MKKVTSLFIFLTGAATGAAIATVQLNKKYQIEKQEDVAYFKKKKEKYEKEIEEYKKKIEHIKNKDENDEKQRAPKQASSHVTIDEINLLKEKIIDFEYEQNKENKEKKGDTNMCVPYIINPDDFGELPDYETATLIYYSDHVLTDEDDHLIEDIDSIVGIESLSYFSETQWAYEPNSIFVRNDEHKTDYEILYRDMSYSDAIGYDK